MATLEQFVKWHRAQLEHLYDAPRAEERAPLFPELGRDSLGRDTEHEHDRPSVIPLRSRPPGPSI